MQELWFACLENLNEGIRAEIEADETRQCLLDHFLWDWFKKYSEARPIVRVARFYEPTDLRLANHLEDWSLSPWEPWEVIAQANEVWHLRQLGSHREVDVRRAFGHHHWDVGDALLTRVIHHAGHDFTGLHVSRFEGPAGMAELDRHWIRLAKKHGFPPSSRLRPDIHNEIWLPLHEDLLALVMEIDPDSIVPSDTPSLPQDPLWDASILDLPHTSLAGQTPREAAQNELGRRRLVKWVEGLDHFAQIRIRTELGL